MWIWDIGTGVELRRLEGHEGAIMDLDLSPDGRWVVSVGVDKLILRWDIEAGGPAAFVRGASSALWSVAYHPDGKRFLTGGADEAVHIWNIRDNGEIEPSHRPADRVEVAVDNSDGRGARLFRACRACHTLNPDGGNKAGPTLYGLFGRRIGSTAGYSYSEVMKRSAIIWDETNVNALFDLGPDRFVPGSKMPMQRMPDPKDRADLISYLKRVTAVNLRQDGKD